MKGFFNRWRWWIAGSIGFGVIGVLIWASYRYRVSWTGFYTPPTGGTREEWKTLWDWMDLFIIPLVLVFGGFLLNRAQRRGEQKIANDRQKQEQQIAKDREEERVLQDYLDVMTRLLLQENLDKTRPEDQVRVVARALTLSILRRLGGLRKGIVLRFLAETDLIIGDEPVISLQGADLHGAKMRGADLTYAKFQKANLSTVNLGLADLSSANLEEANLKATFLIDANLHGASLRGANLSGTALSKADLSGADLSEADLSGAYLDRAKIDERTQIDDKWRLVWKILNSDEKVQDLSGVDLSEANLCWADLGRASLKGADLQRSYCSSTNLSEANLSEANLCGANLREANLEGAILRQAKYDQFTMWPKDFDPKNHGAFNIEGELPHK